MALKAGIRGAGFGCKLAGEAVVCVRLLGGGGRGGGGRKKKREATCKQASGTHSAVNQL